MAVDMDKMKGAVKKKKRRRIKPEVDWDGICGYDGSGDTIGLTHEGVEHMTDKAALMVIEGSKYWVPFSQIFDADDEAVIVTDWWWERAEAVD